MSTDFRETVPQRYWIVALQEIDFERLKKFLELYLSNNDIKIRTRAEAGLELMEVRESVHEESFYLGEVPISHCEVSVHCRSSDESSIGFCKVMADDAEAAYFYAIADGILQLGQGFRELEELVEVGFETWKKKQEEHRKICSATKLDFSLL